jgi:cysteine-rich repeat protein
MRAKLKTGAIALLLAIVILPAHASFHLMKVVEVFPGTAVAPNAQYVVIQMYSSGQQFVGGHDVTVFNAAGTAVATFTFPGDLPNGNNQAKILIATPEAQTFFNLTADLIMSPSLLAAGGKVCFAGTIDCVAWGAYTGSSSGVGTPFNASGGLQRGRAAVRRLDIAGSPTFLDSADDTNNCANDFMFGLPAPRNNAGTAGTIPGSTCGNGTLEGLEQCDDHNLNSGDGCSSTCTVEASFAKLSIADVAITEGNSGTKLATFTVMLSQASVSPVTYNIATANGTASAGSDYVAKSLVGESIPAGQTSRTFTVTINGDLTKEPNETFAVNVGNVMGAMLLDGQALGTIQNDDSSLLSVANVEIAEGNSGTKLATFTVRLSQPSSTAVTYSIATANHSATAGSDYVAKSLVGESIAAGLTSRTFTVTINGDAAVEANESFTVNVTNVVGASVSDGLAAGTILNDDGRTLSIADVAIAEGNSGTRLATFTVKLSQVSGAPVTYNIATANSTASAGSDYVAGSLSGQSIPAGQLSKTFSVTINGDTALEANEAFSVNVSGAVGATVFDGQALGTILNDEGTTLSIADVAIAEGNSGTRLATFTVRLSQASGAPVTYNIATATGVGTASIGSDYVAGSLTGQSIPAGQTSKAFSVTINGDTAAEANETFVVSVSSVAGATVFDGAALGTILNDD